MAKYFLIISLGLITTAIILTLMVQLILPLEQASAPLRVTSPLAEPANATVSQSAASNKIQKDPCNDKDYTHSLQKIQPFRRCQNDGDCELIGSNKFIPVAINKRYREDVNAVLHALSQRCDATTIFHLKNWRDSFGIEFNCTPSTQRCNYQLITKDVIYARQNEALKQQITSP